MTHPNPDPLYVPPDPAPLRRGIAWGLIIEVVAIAVVLGLAWLAFSPKPAASSAGDCGVVLTHVGGLYVDVHDDGDMWLSFDAIEGTVDLTIDGPNGIELAPGDYRAVWDDGTSEPFTLACLVEPDPTDDPPLEVAGEDPTTPPPAVAARTTGEASWYDDGPGLYGAVHSFRFGDPPYFVKVCRTDAAAVCVRVVVRDHMANEVRAIDLSPEAFVALAPLDRGVVQVTVETYSDGPSPTLPATDVAP